jgi:hypothetical protein
MEIGRVGRLVDLDAVERLAASGGADAQVPQPRSARMRILQRAPPQPPVDCPL